MNRALASNPPLPRPLDRIWRRIRVRERRRPRGKSAGVRVECGHRSLRQRARPTLPDAVDEISKKSSPLRLLPIYFSPRENRRGFFSKIFILYLKRQVSIIRLLKEFLKVFRGFIQSLKEEDVHFFPRRRDGFQGQGKFFPRKKLVESNNLEYMDDDGRRIKA